MAWTVAFHDAFAAEFQEWRHDIQKAVATQLVILETLRPTLGRPHADTLKGSRHKNMKELRFSVGDGEWRVAYAFDPRRHAIVLVGASKSGVSADRRFDEHLADLRGGRRS
jgi:hypothetical protein